VGHHKTVVDVCYHASDNDEQMFVGETSGLTYRLNENGNKYYQLLDLGTFGLGVRSSQCMVRSTNWLWLWLALAYMLLWEQSCRGCMFVTSVRVWNSACVDRGTPQR